MLLYNGKCANDLNKLMTLSILLWISSIPLYNTDKLERTTLPCVLWDPRKSIQNPAYQCQLIKFFCRTGYHLTISTVGRVCGQKNPHDQIGTEYKFMIMLIILLIFIFMFRTLSRYTSVIWCCPNTKSRNGTLFGI